MISETKEIGKFRLESHNKKAIFIANKIYIYKDQKDKEHYKLRGITKEEEPVSVREIAQAYKQQITEIINQKSFTFEIRMKDKNKEIKTYEFKTIPKRKIIKENQTRA